MSESGVCPMCQRADCDVFRFPDESADRNELIDHYSLWGARLESELREARERALRVFDAHEREMNRLLDKAQPNYGCQHATATTPVCAHCSFSVGPAGRKERKRG